MKKKLFFLAAVAALVALNGPAFTVTGEEALLSFQQRMNGVTMLKGNISMTFTNGRVYTGKFSYLAPGRIRVAFSNPKGKLIVSNGVQLWVYDEGEKICATQNLGVNLSGGIGAFVQGYAPLLTGSEGQPVIKLKGDGEYPDVTPVDRPGIHDAAGHIQEKRWLRLFG